MGAGNYSRVMSKHKKSEKEEKGAAKRSEVTEEKKPKAKKASGKKADAVKKAEVTPEVAPVVAEAAPKKAATKARKPAAPRKKKPVAPTVEEVALRAYFIAERRQNMGWPGDETSDWVEAELQLKREAGFAV